MYRCIGIVICRENILMMYSYIYSYILLLISYIYTYITYLKSNQPLYNAMFSICLTILLTL